MNKGSMQAQPMINTQESQTIQPVQAQPFNKSMDARLMTQANNTAGNLPPSSNVQGGIRPVTPSVTPPPLPDAAASRPKVSNEIVNAATAAAGTKGPAQYAPPIPAGFGAMFPGGAVTPTNNKAIDAVVGPAIQQQQLTLDAIDKLRASGMDPHVTAAIDKLQGQMNDRDTILQAQQQRLVEKGQNKYSDAIDLANVTPEGYRRQRDMAAEDAQLFDPRSQSFQDMQQGQGTIYDKLLSTATGTGPTAGQMQLEAQYSRGSNQARQNAMQAALATGASPAAAARAASMASENFTRGLGDQIAGTGMQERLAYLDAAGQFGQSQQNADFGRYSQMRDMEQQMLAQEQSQSMDILNMQNNTNSQMQQNAYNQRMAGIAQQNADTARKQVNANIGIGAAGAAVKGIAGFAG